MVRCFVRSGQIICPLARKILHSPLSKKKLRPLCGAPENAKPKGMEQEIGSKKTRMWFDQQRRLKLKLTSKKRRKTVRLSTSPTGQHTVVASMHMMERRAGLVTLVSQW